MMELIVCVVDDDEEMRQSLDSLLGSIGLSVQTFASASEFLASCDANHIGCLLLDVRMPRMSGLMLQDELIARQVDVPIIFLSGHADPQTVADAMKKGAYDFLVKPFNNQVLLDSVQQALACTRRQSEQKATTRAIRTRLTLLSAREREVLERVKKRQPVKVIAQEMVVSRKTIDTHLGAIRQKMRAESTAEVLLMLHGHACEASLRCTRCRVHNHIRSANP